MLQLPLSSTRIHHQIYLLITNQGFAIISTQDLRLNHFSSTLRNFHHNEDYSVHPNMQSVHLKVKNDNIMQSIIVGEKELRAAGHNMEVIGDVSECGYEDLVEKKMAKWTRPQYKLAK
jgi:hypothetical protein